MNRLRIGLIGASPGPGWAARAHVPALLALDEIELAAVATTRRESADAAARAYGVARAYASAAALIADPALDAVAIVVKVPEHGPLVEQAIAAGKHVLCEWPLARDLAEAEHLRDLAARSDRVHLVGLQARRSPVLAYVRDLIAQGYVGRVLSCDLVDSTPGHGTATLPPRRAWMADRTRGANVFTIKGGHSLDALAWTLGDRIVELDARLVTRTPRARLEATGEEVTVTSPDQAAIAAVLAGGALAAVHIQGGAPKTSGVRFEIHGDRGSLFLAGDDSAQTSRLELRGATDAGEVAPLPVPAAYEDDLTRRLPANVANVARAYRAFAEAIRTGTALHPDFADATEHHRLIDAIEHASATGSRRRLA